MRTGRAARGALCALALVVAAAAPLRSALAAGGGEEIARAAQAAARKLEEAAADLAEAERARDRIKVLTRTIRAYEDGLQAMREGLRRAAIREAAIRMKLEARSEDLSALLAALQQIEATPRPALLLHPEGAVATARAGMLLAELTPALRQRAGALKAELDELRLLKAVQESSAEKLRQGLQEVHEARIALSRAVSQRRDLPRRFADDPVKTALLIESSQTLTAFAQGLLQSQGPLVAVSEPVDFESLRGQLPLPVAGTLLRGYNEADAAGIRRPGLVVATRENALVTSPAAATIRYRGPLLDYGNVIILEPSGGYLLVLAGLNQVFGETGQVVEAGAPLGLMGPGRADTVARQGQAEAGTSAQERSQTLYLELRKGREPVNPEEWFVLDKERTQ